MEKKILFTITILICLATLGLLISNISAYPLNSCNSNNKQYVTKSPGCTTNFQCSGGYIKFKDFCGCGCEKSNNSLINCSRNSDCGNNEFVNGFFCRNGNVFQNFTTARCVNPGTTRSYCSNATRQILQQYCNRKTEVCSNGACIAQNITCYRNSDCGNNGFINNTQICRSGNVFGSYITHVCNRAGTGQSYCTNFTRQKLSQACCKGQPCINGTCLNLSESRCKCNSDCGNDSFTGDNFCRNGNVYRNFTKFICNRAGWKSSFCTNTTSPVLTQTCGANEVCSNGSCVSGANITCFNNTQCGVNGFVDGLFCRLGNVFQNFTYYTCNNPGTLNSSCSSSTVPILNLTCGENLVCSNGGCVNGTNVTITCNSNSQCGNNSFIGNPTCENGSVYQSFLVYNCNNPGTAQSFCSTDTLIILKSECGENQACSNGTCINNTIICSSNSECGNDSFTGNAFCDANDVFRNFTSHTCNNPGTMQSFCSNITSDILADDCTDATQICLNGSCINRTIVNVSIMDFFYDPSHLIVNTGDIVAWTNNGEANHTVDSDAGNELNSGIINPGQSYYHIFDSNGTFPYHCSLHPNMTGNISVE